MELIRIVYDFYIRVYGLFCFDVLDYFYIYNYFLVSVINLFSSYFVLINICSNSVFLNVSFKINV